MSRTSEKQVKIRRNTTMRAPSGDAFSLVDENREQKSIYIGP